MPSTTSHASTNASRPTKDASDPSNTNATQPPADSLPFQHMADQPTTSDALIPAAASIANQSPAAHGQTAYRRDLFWQNVVREILSSLAVTAATFSGRLSPTASGAATTPAPEHELFDGRMAVITRLGQRIPIADVYPVFACSVPKHGPSRDRLLAADVQCSIFQIRTPSGEVYTLPVHEIASIHALSESLVRQMEAAARAQAGDDNPSQPAAPFGFAAFTSLAQSERDHLG